METNLVPSFQTREKTHLLARTSLGSRPPERSSSRREPQERGQTERRIPFLAEGPSWVRTPTSPPRRVTSPCPHLPSTRPEGVPFGRTTRAAPCPGRLALHGPCGRLAVKADNSFHTFSLTKSFVSETRIKPTVLH